MSTNHTVNYNLSQWAKSDKVLMEDFNADNAKIDAALGSLSSTVGGLQRTVSSHTSALAGKGNCQFYATSYTGTGLVGADYPTSLTFPHKPMAVVITMENNLLVLLRGASAAFTQDDLYYIPAGQITWGERSVSWYAGGTKLQMSGLNVQYQVFALLQTE